MRLRFDIFGIWSLVIAFAALAHCNQPSNPNFRTEKLGADAPTDIPLAKLVELKGNIDFEDQPVDALIIQESADTARLRSGPDFQAKISTAAKSLAARLRFSNYDTHLAFATIGSSPSAPTGELDARDGATLIKKDTADLPKLIAKKFTLPPPAAGSLGALGTFQPLSTLKRIVTSQLSKSEAERVVGRKKAFLSALFVVESLEKEEVLLPDDMARFLDESIGVGHWAVSVLTLNAVEEKTGCKAEVAPTPVTGFRLADEPSSSRLVAKLQDRSKGMFLSQCAPSFLTFFDRFLLEAGNSRYFSVKIPSKVMWDNLQVLVDEKPFYGWRYEVGSTVLQLPRLLPKGVPFRLRMEKDDGARPNEAKDEGSIAEPKLSAEEQAFLTDINPIMVKSCGSSSCHGEGSAQQAYVGHFDTVKTSKDSIVERLSKPDADPLKMPKGQTMTPADKDKLLKFLKEIQG